jgi:hypothetical protein
MDDNTNNTKEQVKETIKVKGGQLYKKLNELAKEGNVRKVVIRDKHGKKMVEFPMTLGIAGAVIAPVLASAGLIIFFVTECTVEVHRQKSV